MIKRYLKNEHQHRATKKPLFTKIPYSGATVAQVTSHLVDANKEIPGGSFLSVCDCLKTVRPYLQKLPPP